MFAWYRFCSEHFNRAIGTVAEDVEMDCSRSLHAWANIKDNSSRGMFSHINGTYLNMETSILIWRRFQY